MKFNVEKLRKLKEEKIIFNEESSKKFVENFKETIDDEKFEDFLQRAIENCIKKDREPEILIGLPYDKEENSNVLTLGSHENNEEFKFNFWVNVSESDSDELKNLIFETVHQCYNLLWDKFESFDLDMLTKGQDFKLCTDEIKYLPVKLGLYKEER